MFSYVRCRQCGRMLRARRSPEPTTIQCWECHAEVKVPRHRLAEGPRPVAQFRGALSEELAELAAMIILLGLAVTVAITVPHAGPWLALAVLTGAALLYLHRVEEAPTPGLVIAHDRVDDGLLSRAAHRLRRLALAVGMVLGLVVPLLMVDGCTQLAYRPPLLPPPLPLAAILLAWVAVPLAAFALVARDERGRLGPRRALAAARGRGWATLLALLLPILAFAATEGVLFGTLARLDRLRTFVVDALPPTEGMEIKEGLVLLHGRKVYLRSPVAVRNYAQGLSRGATLAASVPLSFRRGLEPRIHVQANGKFQPEEFLLSRLGVTGLSMTVVLGAFAVQAGWLGRVAASASRLEDEEEDQEEDVATPAALPDAEPRGTLALPPAGPTVTVVNSPGLAPPS